MNGHVKDLVHMKRTYIGFHSLYYSRTMKNTSSSHPLFGHPVITSKHHILSIDVWVNAYFCFCVCLWVAIQVILASMDYAYIRMQMKLYSHEQKKIQESNTYCLNCLSNREPKLNMWHKMLNITVGPLHFTKLFIDSSTFLIFFFKANSISTRFKSLNLPITLKPKHNIKHNVTNIILSFLCSLKVWPVSKNWIFHYYHILLKSWNSQWFKHSQIRVVVCPATISYFWVTL